MKRQKPLARTKPLSPGKPLERKTALKASSSLKPGGSLKRTAIKRRPKMPRSPEEQAAAVVWHSVVTRYRKCAVTGLREGELYPDPTGSLLGLRVKIEGHHILSQQFLRRLARRLGVPAKTIVWDERIGMPLNHLLHESYTKRMRSIPRACLPASAWDFAVEYGVEEHLARLYPEERP